MPEGEKCNDCRLNNTWVEGRCTNALCPGGTFRRMAKPSMEVNISFRVSRGLRDAAREKAEERQESVSDVLRDALEHYAAGRPATVKRDEFAAERRAVIVEALSWWEDGEGRWGHEKAAEVLAAHEGEWGGLR